MSTQNALPVAEVELPSVHLVARNTNEMELSRGRLLQWLTQKVETEKAELADVLHAFEIAHKNKWSSSTLERQAKRCADRVQFYTKILTAVAAGFTIIPNFPVDYFAVRVQRPNPRAQLAEIKNASEYEDASTQVTDEEPQILPPGDGRYVNPSQLVKRSSLTEKDEKTGKESLTKLAWPTSFADLVFPVECARPEIMSATAEAISLKLFDAIGICPQGTVNADPLIIARILQKKYSGHQERKMVSFLLAWHLDLRTL